MTAKIARDVVFERRTQALIDRDVRSNRALLKESRSNAGAAWRRRMSRLVSFPILATILPITLITSIVTEPRGVEILLLGVSLYATGRAFFTAQMLLTALSRSHDLSVLALMPVRDGEVFTVLFRRFLWNPLGGLWIFLLSFSAIALRTTVAGGSSGGGGLLPGRGLTGLLVATGFALILWAGMVSMAIALAAFRPAAPFAMAGSVAYLLGITLVMFSSPLDAFFELSKTLILATPAGWISRAFSGGFIDGNLPDLAWLVPAFLLACVVPFAFERMKKAYRIGEWALPSLSGGEAALDVALEGELARRSADREQYIRDTSSDRSQPASTFSGEEARRLRDAQRVEAEREEREQMRRWAPSWNEAAIGSGEFLDAADWSQSGLIEQVAVRWLSDREKLVFEFMAGRTPGWTPRWVLALVVCAIGSLVTLAVPAAGLAILMPAIVLSGLLTAPLFGGMWPGFSLVRNGGQFTPIYTGFPIGYREISFVAFKVNTVRCLFWLPLLVGSGAIVALQTGIHPGFGAAAGIKIVYGIIVLQPILIATRFSRGTNGTEGIKTVSLAILLGVIAGGIGLLAGAGLMLAGRPILWIPGMVLLPLVSIGGWLFYSLLYHRSEIDLFTRRLG